MSTARVIRYVPATAFKPAPKVESAIICVTPREQGVIDAGEVDGFRVFVQGAFGMRRKQMINVLRAVGRMPTDAAAAMLAQLDIDPRARPETLSPEQFAMLLRATNALVGINPGT